MTRCCKEVGTSTWLSLSHGSTNIEPTFMQHAAAALRSIMVLQSVQSLQSSIHSKSGSPFLHVMIVPSLFPMTHFTYYRSRLQADLSGGSHLRSSAEHVCHARPGTRHLTARAGNEDFTITEKASTRAFSWLKAPNSSAFTFKNLWRQMPKHGK